MEWGKKSQIIHIEALKQAKHRVEDKYEIKETFRLNFLFDQKN